jgi:AAHS family 4-hydroxybenzoate transporter-like MFS transporter
LARSAAATGGVTDISRTIDEGVWSNYQKLVIVIAALAIVLDGFANQALPLSIPMLVKMWGVKREAFTLVSMMGYTGMAIGTILFGMMGDKAGRRPTLMFCVLLFALPTVAVTAIHSVTMLDVLRFIGGMGLGGCMPNAAALLAEVTPARNRSVAVTCGIVGIPVGGTLGGAIAGHVPAEQWQNLYFMAGLVPVAIAVIMFFVLPESPRFLAVRENRKADLVKLMARFKNPIDPDRPAVDSLDKPAKIKVGLDVLFSKEYAQDTIGLWGAMFFTLLSVYGVINWLPTILNEAHYTANPNGATDVLSKFVAFLAGTNPAGVGLMWFNVGGIVAALGGAACFNRFGSKASLMALCIGAMLASAWLYFIPLDPKQSTLTLFTALFFQGGFINAVQTTMYALAAFVYVTEMRGAGVGWAVGFGRIGSIISPLVGIYLLHALGPHGFFAGFGVTMALSLVSLSLIRKHLPPKNATIAAAVPATES